jgi:hypothetical protein
MELNLIRRNKMEILKALEVKYPAAGFVLVGNVYSGLRAIKDNGSGSEMPDPDNMITEEEYNEAIAEFEVFDGWVKVRKQRNQLLKDSDYIMFPDITISAEKKEEWETYRQSLRDIPQTFSNPDDVTYPDKPE